MKKIDYKSRVHPPEPIRDLEHQFGCFLLIGAGLLVVAVSFVDFASAFDPLAGLARPKRLPCIPSTLLAAGGWCMTILVFHRRSGLLCGVPLALATFVATIACLRLPH